jgi:DNA primase
LSGSLASSCEVSRRTLRITNPERADFPSGRSADELCVTDLADVIWAVQMNTVVPSLEHPGPPTWSTPTSGASIWTQPGTGFAQARQVAVVVQEVLAARAQWPG